MPDATPLTASAARVPAISPEDARFHDVTLDLQATAPHAWQSVEAELKAMTTTPAALPTVDLDYAASQIIGLWSTFAQHRTSTLLLLSKAQAADTASALDSLSRLSYALIHVLAQERAESGEGASITALNRDGLALRSLGLRWCQILENLGHVKAGTTKAIKRGFASHSETMRDLQALYDALNPHRSTLTSLAPGATTPLTDADLDRVANLALVMRQTLHTQQPTTTWRVSLLRLAALLERRYEVSTAALRFSLTVTGDTDTLQSIPSFHSLRRPPSPKPPTTSP
jgi:hypothetical protein